VSPAPSLLSRNGVGPSCVALPPGPWPTVLAFLVERFPRVSAPEWQGRMASGDVLSAAGLALLPDAPYCPHAKVYYYRHVPSEPRIPVHEAVLYVDDHLVVADKPHFLPVTPGGRYVSETLLARLKRTLGLDTLSPLHRLDRETAGVVVFSVQPLERDRYHALFRERAVRKEYEAIAPACEALAQPVVRRSRLAEALNFMQMHEVEGEPNAETWVDRLSVAGPLAHYRLRPLTGQRHQLRVHMAALGAPIVGDQIYPVLQAERAVLDMSNPLQLLARRIEFLDPVTGQARCFESALALRLCTLRQSG
jgi:tRNA pseudouridine32 synthase / 23S rRNA pseudouridine746 synthase